MADGHMIPCRHCYLGYHIMFIRSVSRLGKALVVGNVETQGDVGFACTYCSVFAAHKQKITVFPEHLVLKDIAQVVVSERHTSVFQC